jgi:hypothetical protein
MRHMFQLVPFLVHTEDQENEDLRKWKEKADRELTSESQTTLVRPPHPQNRLFFSTPLSVDLLILLQ